MTVPARTARLACAVAIAATSAGACSFTDLDGLSRDTGAGATAGASSATGTGAGHAGGGGGEAPEPGQPPPPGPPSPADGPGVVLAMRRIWLGDKAVDGMPSSVAWMDLGYNIDHLVSDSAATLACKPRASASGDQLWDGNDGIDNSFGRNVVPMLNAVQQDYSGALNARIAEGAFTVILDVEGLGSKKDYNPLLTKLYAGAALGRAAKFDGTDVWPVVSELLKDPGDIESSKFWFTTSYVTDDVWVSGSVLPITIPLDPAVPAWRLQIENAIVTMRLSPDHRSATDGIIAGILELADLRERVQDLAGTFDPIYCDDATLEPILAQIDAAADVLTDGSVDATRECDGISIGIGFEMAEINLGPVAPPVQPAPDPCP
jgi:hypothetical protein